MELITLDNMGAPGVRGNIEVEFYPNQFQRLCVQSVILECRYIRKGISDETHSAITLNIECFNVNQLLYIRGELLFVKRKTWLDEMLLKRVSDRIELLKIKNKK